MKIRSGIYFAAAILLLLAGCSSVVPPAGSPAPVPELNAQESTPLPGTEQETLPQQQGESIAPAAEPKPAMSANHAVIALLDRAQRDNDAGRHGAADTSLERALRIEPRNPWLWHEIAQLRLSQGQYAQAISLAKKSNSFAGRERRLQALNWRLIGNALVAQGNISAAEEAFKHATELEQIG